MRNQKTAMNVKKSILHLTPLAEIGGCEVNCLRIIEGCSNFGHRVAVFDARGPMSAEWERAGARLEHLGIWRSGLSRFTAELAKWCRGQNSPDAVIYWSTSRLPTILRALRLWDAPWAVHLGNPVQQGLVSSIRRRFADWTHGAPSGVRLVACSQYVAESHRQAAYFQQFPIEVIYNPVDPALDTARHPPGSSDRQRTARRYGSTAGPDQGSQDFGPRFGCNYCYPVGCRARICRRRAPSSESRARSTEAESGGPGAISGL